MTLSEFDRNFYCDGLCGVDEAGRGPLAGDVYAAAVILPADCVLEGLNDSKKLSEKKREALYEEITQKATAYCVATASVAEIEELNILNATFLAMRRAVEGLSAQPKLVLVDGNRDPGLSLPTRCVVKGDALSASIAAASILAKVSRDRYMKQVAAAYPQYQFEKHKGYGTKLHYELLDRFGESPVHRHSFLKKYYAQKEQNPPAKRPVSAENGQFGEELACRYLEDHGCRILARNYHCTYGELDIVAQSGETLLLVEVKTRSDAAMVAPQEAVPPQKRQKLAKTALCYLQQNPCGLALRFDVAEVFLHRDRPPSIRYLKRAFDVEGMV